MVLVGPSDCGKTTALPMVAGFENVTERGILSGGEAVNDMEPRERDMAMVFPNHSYPYISVFPTRRQLAGGVRLTETVGSERLVHCRFGLRSRSASRERAEIAVDAASGLHFFDLDTGAAIR